MSTVGWVTTEEVLSWWEDAPLDSDVLIALLQAAYELCATYAPADVAQPVPETFRRAQYLQAKAMWESERSNAGSSIGAEDFAVPVFPMDWHVKNLLRPKRGTFNVG